MSYNGVDRRIHKVFLTKNTEYHIRRDMCVGVRDRHTGQWIRVHMALQSKVDGSIHFNPNGGVIPHAGSPKIGDSILFRGQGKDIITSTILSVERPPRDIVAQYNRNHRSN